MNLKITNNKNSISALTTALPGLTTAQSTDEPQNANSILWVGKKHLSEQKRLIYM